MLKLVTIILFVFKNTKHREGLDERPITENIRIDTICKHLDNKNKLTLLQSNNTNIFDKLKIANQVLPSNEIKPFNIFAGGLLNEWTNN